MRDRGLTERIEHYHRRSRGTYGAPQLHEDLVEEGHRVGRKRVSRLMQAAGLRGVSRRRSYRTTVRDHAEAVAPDLVQRNFAAAGPDELWVADITYVPTVLDALGMALQQRRPDGVIHHSDQGSQYTSLEFGRRCRQAGVRPSTGSVGDCYDNALCESFFATLECELIDRHSFRSRAEARLEVFDFIEGSYNPYRRHSGIGHMSPARFEELHRYKPAASRDTRSTEPDGPADYEH